MLRKNSVTPNLNFLKPEFKNMEGYVNPSPLTTSPGFAEKINAGIVFLGLCLIALKSAIVGIATINTLRVHGPIYLKAKNMLEDLSKYVNKNPELAADIQTLQKALTELKNKTEKKQNHDEKTKGELLKLSKSFREIVKETKPAPEKQETIENLDSQDDISQRQKTLEDEKNTQANTDQQRIHDKLFRNYLNLDRMLTNRLPVFDSKNKIIIKDLKNEQSEKSISGNIVAESKKSVVNKAAQDDSASAIKALFNSNDIVNDLTRVKELTIEIKEAKDSQIIKSKTSEVNELLEKLSHTYDKETHEEYLEDKNIDLLDRLLAHKSALKNVLKKNTQMSEERYGIIQSKNDLAKNDLGYAGTLNDEKQKEFNLRNNRMQYSVEDNDGVKNYQNPEYFDQDKAFKDESEKDSSLKISKPNNSVKIQTSRGIIEASKNPNNSAKIQTKIGIINAPKNPPAKPPISLQERKEYQADLKQWLSNHNPTIVFSSAKSDAEFSKTQESECKDKSDGQIAYELFVAGELL